MRLTARSYLLLLTTAVIIAPTIAATAAEVPAQLALPGEGHLTSAWIPESGPALVAWESTEGGWSKVALYAGRQAVREWSFDDGLVKDVRWIAPGKTLRLGIVDENGPHLRVYSVDRSGGLELKGSTEELVGSWDQVDLSPDAAHWVATRFRPGEATVAVGQLGAGAPTWTWELSASELGPAKSAPGVDDLFNRAEILASPQPLVAVLWGGRMWLAQVGSTRRAELTPPGDCRGIQTFTSTSDGLWVQCFRGLGTKPSHLWGYFRVEIPPAGGPGTAQVTGSFRKPWFLPQGTVVDLDAVLGEAWVYAIVPDRDEPARLGRLEGFAGGRHLPAGEALLETSGTTEEYRVLPVGGEIADLRRAAGLDP